MASKLESHNNKFQVTAKSQRSLQKILLLEVGTITSDEAITSNRTLVDADYKDMELLYGAQALDWNAISSPTFGSGTGRRSGRYPHALVQMTGKS
jgi:hypothetical protein